MPPIPPGGIPGAAADFSSCFSATIALGGKQQARDRRRVLQSRANDFGRVDDTGLNQVFELLAGRIESERSLVVLDLVDDYRAFPSRVSRDPPAGPSTAFLTMPMPTFSSSLGTQIVERARGANQRDAAAGNHALFDRGAGGMQRVFDARLLFLHLDFSRGADPDHGHAADQLGQPLLQLLAIVVGGGLIDLGADLLDPPLDVGLLAGAVDDRGVVLVDDDALGAAEVVAA